MEKSAKLTIKPLAIQYHNNQLADSDLWDGFFTLILLLGINEFLSSDAQNITFLLLRIGTFIKQYSFGDEPAKNFLKLADIGFTAWHLINIIYKFSWDCPSADENRMFHQCVSLHFTPVAPKAPKSTSSPSLAKLNISKLTDPINNKKSYA